jgi:hypothetical protein
MIFGRSLPFKLTTPDISNGCGEYFQDPMALDTARRHSSADQELIHWMAAGVPYLVLAEDRELGLTVESALVYCCWGGAGPSPQLNQGARYIIKKMAANVKAARSHFLLHIWC